ncbi:hypothetical protein ACTU45_30385 [Streptomyces sp. 24-1644]|uniref:hypothetical protein n=1 Tax=Streptomyces sp. 24-1644 TaxID=3457315 RepID=UPI003FA79969
MSDVVARGFTNVEYGVSCHACAAGLFIGLGERGFLSTSGDYALSDDHVETLVASVATATASEPGAFVHSEKRR